MIVALAAVVGLILSVAFVLLGALLIYGDLALGQDLMGFVTVIAGGGALLTLLVYAPVLHFSRTLLRSRSIRFGAFFGALPLNLPVFVIIAVGVARGGTFAGGEGPLIAGAFAVLGATVGAAYTWQLKRNGQGQGQGQGQGHSNVRG
jgi:hypothetical protein